jgi:hypothetical protein
LHPRALHVLGFAVFAFVASFFVAAFFVVVMSSPPRVVSRDSRAAARLGTVLPSQEGAWNVGDARYDVVGRKGQDRGDIAS